MVNEYFAWIPKGAPVAHPKTEDAPQTAARSTTLPDRLAQLQQVVVAYHIPGYKSDDQYALSVLGAILGEGSSSRLDRALVNPKGAPCLGAGAGAEPLEYAGIFEVEGTVKPGADVGVVKKALADQVADLLANGVTPAELAKAKTSRRVETIHGRQTCEEIAGAVGDEALWANDPDRVNTDLAKLDAVTAEQVQAVARKYLQPDQATTVVVEPDPLGIASRKAAGSMGAAAALYKEAAVAPSTQPIKPRDVTFPAGYPEHPPHGRRRRRRPLRQGDRGHRQRRPRHRPDRSPLAAGQLDAGHAARQRLGPDGQARPGQPDRRPGHARAGEMTFQQMSDQLDQHGIRPGRQPRRRQHPPQRQLHDRPARPGLRPQPRRAAVAHVPPGRVRPRQGPDGRQRHPGVGQPRRRRQPQMKHLLYGDTVQGRSTSPATVAAITEGDVKQFYATYYRPDDAILTISGDVSFDRGVQLAHGLLDGWAAAAMPTVNYDLPTVAEQQRQPHQIVLIDNPDGSAGAGAIVAMGARATTSTTTRRSSPARSPGPCSPAASSPA